MSVDGVRVSDGGVRLVFVKSGITPGGFCSSLNDSIEACNVLRARRTGGCVMCEERVCASRHSAA